MRKVKILNNGYIEPISMDGPVVSPIVVDDRTVFDLVKRGYEVVEVAIGMNKTTKLTLANINDPNRFNDLVGNNPVFTPTGKALDGVATPVTPISANVTAAPTPVAITRVNEAQHLTKAERKAKRREEEAAKRAAEEANTETAAEDANTDTADNSADLATEGAASDTVTEDTTTETAE